MKNDIYKLCYSNNEVRILPCFCGRRTVVKCVKIEEAIAEIRNQSKKKFIQTLDLNVNLANIDTKKPENRFSKEVMLPHGRGKEVTVGIISDTIENSITKTDLEELTKDMKKTRALINKYDYFLCEAPLMVTVGKVLGKYLGPRGKMPSPLPPKAPVEAIVNNLKKSVTVRLADSLAINVPIGVETMKDEELKDNAIAVINLVKSSLPKGADQIKNISIKTTMGKPVKFNV